MNTPAERLVKIPMFAALKEIPGALEKVASLVHTQRFKPETYIIREGETGDSMFVLNEGSVRIEKKTLSDDAFTVIVLKTDMNIFFGEIALMDNDVRSASVVAATECECFVIHKADFEALAESDPRIGYYVIREIIKSLTARLRRTTQDSVNLIAALISEESDD